MNWPEDMTAAEVVTEVLNRISPEMDVTVEDAKRTIAIDVDDGESNILISAIEAGQFDDYPFVYIERQLRVGDDSIEELEAINNDNLSPALSRVAMRDGQVIASFAAPLDFFSVDLLLAIFAEMGVRIDYFGDGPNWYEANGCQSAADALSKALYQIDSDIDLNLDQAGEAVEVELEPGQSSIFINAFEGDEQGRPSLIYLQRAISPIGNRRDDLEKANDFNQVPAMARVALDYEQVIVSLALPMAIFTPGVLAFVIDNMSSQVS